jgi:hypothetical protein
MGLGSGIWKIPIPDPGVKKAPNPGSGSATLRTHTVEPVRSRPNSSLSYLRAFYFRLQYQMFLPLP